MAYQRIFVPGPRSNRFAFAGLGACCRACELGLKCGSLAGAAGAKTAAVANAAGADPSLAQLATDVKALAVAAHNAWGDVQLNRTLYDRLKRQAAAPAQSGFRLLPEEAKQFVTGTVVDVTSAYVKGMQLAQIAAPTEARRNQLLATQRQLASAARGMLDQAIRALEGAQQEGGGRAGTSGLGIVCGGLCIAAIAAVALSVVIIVTGAAVYSWAQSAQELNGAMTMADRICRESPGGCSAQERAQILSSLRMPDPVSRGVENVTAGIGRGLQTTIIVVGVGGAVSLAFYAWLRLTPAGRRLHRKFTGRAA